MKDKTGTKGYQNELDVLKVITIILVILAHVTRMYSGVGIIKMEQNNILDMITKYIYSFHMPLFVSISGAIYYIGKRENRKYKHRIDFVKSKFRRLLVPYLFFSLFYVLPTMQIIGAVHENSTIYFMKNYLLAIDPRHLWYVMMLFLLFIIYDLFENTINQHTTSFLIFFILLNLISPRIPMIFQVGSVARYCLYFHLGYIYRKINLINRLPTDKVIIYVFINLFLFVSIEMYVNGILNHLLHPLVSISGCMMMTVIAKIILNKKLLAFRQLLLNSYGIYLFHPMIIYLIFFYFRGLVTNPYAFSAAVFVTSILLSNFLTNLFRYIGLSQVIGETH